MTPKRSISHFDLTGREGRSLAHHEWVTAGRHRRAWDGLVDGGGAAPLELCFIRLGIIDGLRTRGREVEVRAWRMR